MKILIIDDEYLARASLKTQLDNLGDYELFEAESAAGALEIMEAEKPDAAFVDIQMPEMSGIEFMEQARKLSFQSVFVVLSGYNLFEYAQKAIEFGTYKYLLKPISDESLASLMQEIENQVLVRQKERQRYEELYQSDKKRIRILQRKYVYELLGASADRRERILQLLEENGVIFSGPCFQVIMIHMGAAAPEDEELLKFGIENIADEIYKEIAVTVCFFEEEREMGLLLNLEKPIQLERSDKRLESMYQEMTRFTNILDIPELTLGAGEMKTGSDKLEEAYDSAKQALNMYLVAGTNKIYYAGEKTGLEKFSRQYWEKRFERELLVGNQEGLESCIEELYTKYQSGSLTNIKELHKLHLSFFVMLRKSVEETAAEFGEVLEDEFWLYRKIQKFGTIEEMKRFLLEKVSFCFQVFMNSSKTGNQRAVQKGKQFIEENLGNELTLNAAAEHVNLSAVYFSRIFKEEEGQNFIDYVTQRRMQLACELLENNVKTAEICDRIGYHDMKHFYKVFKKNMGISPGQYKKKIGK